MESFSKLSVALEKCFEGEPEKWFEMFSENNNYKIIKKQTIFIRSNCMDCIDRTNITQSFLSNEILKEILV